MRVSVAPNTTPFFADLERTQVLGLVVRKTSWRDGVFFVMGCHEGVAHMLGYVVDANHVPAILTQFFHRMRGNAHEWENDGV